MHVYLSININHSFCSLLLFVNTVCKVNKKQKYSCTFLKCYKILFLKFSCLFPVLLEISRILNTKLDMETLSICVRLCEQGINPEALSSVIKELRKATEALKVEIHTFTHSE